MKMNDSVFVTTLKSNPTDYTANPRHFMTWTSMKE